MSNCSNHRKDVHGETDMKHLAEEIGNLHYETLRNFLCGLSVKLLVDSRKDSLAGRKLLADQLLIASGLVDEAAAHINKAWQICKPFMTTIEPNPERIVETGDAILTNPDKQIKS